MADYRWNFERCHWVSDEDYDEIVRSEERSQENLLTFCKCLMFAVVLFIALAVMNWLASFAWCISPSTCRIIGINPATCMSDEGGSGVLVAKDDDFGYVLTAKHVVESKLNGHRYVVIFPKAKRTYAFSVLECKADWREDGVDLALLKIAPPMEVLPRPVAWRQAVAGEKVWQSGFGNWRETPSESWMRVLPRRQVIGGVTIETGDETLLHTDRSCRSGDSGGPIVDSEGRVIGIITSADETNGYHVRLDGQEWLKSELPPPERSILVR